MLEKLGINTDADNHITDAEITDTDFAVINKEGEPDSWTVEFIKDDVDHRGEKGFLSITMSDEKQDEKQYDIVLIVTGQKEAVSTGEIATIAAVDGSCLPDEAEAKADVVTGENEETAVEKVEAAIAAGTTSDTDTRQAATGEETTDEATTDEGKKEDTQEDTKEEENTEQNQDQEQTDTQTDTDTETQSQTQYRVFDISLNNVDTKAYEGGFKVSVSLPEEIRGASKFQLYHLHGNEEPERIDMTTVGSVDEKTGLETVSGFEFVTDGFSEFVLRYTVDFTYEGRTWSFPGQGSYRLSDVLAVLGIEGNVDEAALTLIMGEDHAGALYLTQADGEYYINSDIAFTDTYELRVRSAERVYLISVTDTQTSADLSDFLKNAVITGATQDPNGSYHVEAGEEYSIILTFAEGSDYQFDNTGTLSYQIPEGIEILTRQESDGNINIVYKGRTYQVGFHYVLDTDGSLKINFDTNDPDFPRLEESTNVSFRFTYTGEFDGSKTTIKFNDVIEKDITFDEPEPGQAYAEKTATYDETTGTFHYTITVTATGDNITSVNVKDIVTGDVLIVDTDSLVISGNSTTPTGGIDGTGFNYTFPSMQEGEVITIKYDAHVDFSQDNGDGKITVDQTRNSVTVDPEPGDPHTSEYSREITYKYTVKHPGTEAGTTEDGDKIINWEIEYNPLALVAVGGDRITDIISDAADDYMKYYGEGITVQRYDHSGNPIGDPVSVSYSNLTDYADNTWTYTIPAADTTPYKYVIRYQTIVDMAAVNGLGVGKDLDNTANDSSSSIHVAPENKIDVSKKAESYTTQEVTWNITLSIPQEGLTSAVVTDYLPAMTDYETTAAPASYQDLFKEDSLKITPELQDGEGYDVTYSNGSIVITFYKNVNTTPKTPGLNGVAGGRTINVRLTTLVDQEWLQAGYEVPRFQNHVNKIDFNGKTDTATVIFGKPGIEKTAVTPDGKSFLYSILISGLKEDSFSITDTFDTSLLEVDTSKASDGNHMRIFGGTQYSQIAGKTPVSYTDTTDGIVITGNSVPKQPDGNYYPYYRIDYYLKLKNGVDLEQLAIANGGEYDLTNTANWSGHESSFTYKTKYDFLNKELLNAGELGDTSRKAQYRITFNPAGATLNNGEPMVMTDVMSANLSVDYSSIRIVTDPQGQEVPYSLSGGKDEHGVSNGTTVATYTVPDSTRVVIEETAARP